MLALNEGSSRFADETRASVAAATPLVWHRTRNQRIARPPQESALANWLRLSHPRCPDAYAGHWLQSCGPFLAGEGIHLDRERTRPDVRQVGH